METAPTTLLIVDDDRNNLLALEKVFLREGMRVLCAANGADAIELCRAHQVDVVLTDMRMPGMDGIELLDQMSTVSPDSEVVLMTAYGTVESAVEAIKKGAYDFVEKPVKRAAIVKIVRKAMEKHFLLMENRTLKRTLQKVAGRTVVGNSPVFRRTLEVAAQAAPSVATVLITGESGTGKEVLARYLHDNSPRREMPFVAVNCAALPESILEAELFGYDVGAFTGAVKRRDGRFVMAHEGTVFLDEVAEMSPAVQVKLLRILQERVVEPLGGSPRSIDVRVLAATNRDLDKEVERGGFREDLFYRLNVIQIDIPPLRQRNDDIPVLVDVFIQKYAALNGKSVNAIRRAAMDVLMGYYWPGNVRELENVIERAVVLSTNPQLEIEDLPPRIVHEERYQGQITVNVGTPLEEIELRVIRETLRHTGGDKKRAAQLLGIATRTIYRKLDALM